VDARGVGYVLAISCDRRITTGTGVWRADHAAEFRYELAERGLAYVVQVSGDLNAYPAETVRTITPRGRIGRPPQPRCRDPVSTLAKLVTTGGSGTARRVTWRQGSRRRSGHPQMMSSRFVTVGACTSVSRGCAGNRKSSPPSDTNHFPTAHPKINLGVRRLCVLVEPDRQSEPLVYGCLVGRVVVNQRCAEVAEAVDDVRDLVGG
jgi:DDE superfamily endonuclease